MTDTGSLSSAIRKERRKARKAVFQALYAMDSNGEWSVVAARNHLSGIKPALTAGSMLFAVQLIDTYFAKRTEIDTKLTAANAKWKLERMGLPERAVLRTAAAELESELETPLAVVISEANELADTFGGPDQASFVSGVLNEIYTSGS